MSDREIIQGFTQWLEAREQQLDLRKRFYIGYTLASKDAAFLRELETETARIEHLKHVWETLRARERKQHPILTALKGLVTHATEQLKCFRTKTRRTSPEFYLRDKAAGEQFWYEPAPGAILFRAADPYSFATTRGRGSADRATGGPVIGPGS